MSPVIILCCNTNMFSDKLLNIILRFGLMIKNWYWKNIYYECGFTPIKVLEFFRNKILFVSLLFIVFDVELILLFPLSLSGISYNYADSMLILLFMFSWF